MAGDLCPYDHGEDPVVMKLPTQTNYMENALPTSSLAPSIKSASSICSVPETIGNGN